MDQEVLVLPFHLFERDIMDQEVLVLPFHLFERDILRN
jgi:hypothetical protein